MILSINFIAANVLLTCLKNSNNDLWTTNKEFHERRISIAFSLLQESFFFKKKGKIMKLFSYKKIFS